MSIESSSLNYRGILRTLVLLWLKMDLPVFLVPDVVM